MEGDREPSTWISAWSTVLIVCSAMPGKGTSSWHECWLEMRLGVIASNQNRNDSLQWKHPVSPQQKYPRPSTEVQESSCWRFSLANTVPGLIDFLQSGITVNAQRYSQTLTIIRQVIKSKPPASSPVRSLLHDNARPHRSNTMTALLQKIKRKVVGHPPYSPDRSPCDYAIFGALEKGSDEGVKQCLRNWFTMQPREFYETVIHRLVSQWDNSQGQYFWHTDTGFCSETPARFFFFMPLI